MEKNKIELKLYLSIILFFLFITSLSVSLYYQISFIYTLLAMILSIMLIIIVDAVSATICRLLPIFFANFNLKIFKVTKKEKSFYEFLKIKKWKELIPEIGHFTGFRKNRISEPNNINYIKRFLHEICYGEIGHFVSMFLGILIIFIPWFNPIWTPICIVTIIVNAILNLLPIFVLRYNSYALSIIYNRLKRKNTNQ